MSEMLRMRRLIADQAEKIAGDLDLDINTLTPRGMEELYTRAEEEVVASLITVLEEER